MKRHLIWLGAACVFLGGWNFWGTTWGSNTVYLPDGAVCGNLCSDGGFFDAGNGSYADSGIAYYDGGVCADGGTSCGFCQGSCSVDGGNGSYDGGPLDGGFQCNALAIHSDPIYASTMLDLACYVTAPGPLSTSANVTMQLIGTPDKAPIPSSLYSSYPNTSQSAAVSDGGSAIVTWLQSVPLFPYTEISVGNNSDAGLLCCPNAAQ
jgi:hypothetical protein